MIRTLIFDWDGTLHNTAHLYGCAFRSAYGWLASEGYAPVREYSDEEVSIYLGMNAREMWNRFMPQLPQEVKEQASAMIGQRMVSAIQAGQATLYPGTEDVLEQLKGRDFQMVILSNCKRAYLEAHRAAFRLDRWFDGFYCGGDFDFAPKEEIFPVIRQHYPEQFVVIGDRDSDFKVAAVHHLASVGCAYGFGRPEERKGVDQIAWSVSEIPERIERLCSVRTERRGKP